MTTFKYYFTLVLLSLLLINCDSSKEEKEVIELSSEKKLIEFKFTNTTNYLLNKSEDVWEFIFNETQNLKKLNATIGVSKHASYSPKENQDFENYTIYTVTAQDKTSTDYTIRAYNKADIFKLKFLKSNNNKLTKDYVCSNASTEIDKDIDLKSLKPTYDIDPDFTLISPKEPDFSKQVEFKLQSKIGTQISFAKTIVSNSLPASEKLAKLTNFMFKASANNGITTDITANISYEIDAITKQKVGKITATIPHTAALNNLTPSIQLSANSVCTPANQKDFTNKIEYTVTNSSDNSSIKYNVIISQEAANNNQLAKITNFKFKASENNGIDTDISANISYAIDANTKQKIGKITATIPHTATLNNLTPYIQLSANSVCTPANQKDFTNKVEYTITNSSDNSSIKYNVTITKADSPTISQLAKITKFQFKADHNIGISTDITATIAYETDANTNKKIGKITANVPHTANIANLTPSITVSESSTYTPQNNTSFTQTVHYNVYNSKDNSQITYNVNITKLAAPTLSTKKEITSFKFETTKNHGLTEDLVYTINHSDKSIKATVAHDFNLELLKTPTIVHNGARIDLPANPNYKYNGYSFTVFAQDKSYRIYKMITSKLPAPPVLSSEKKLLSFKFLKANNSGVANFDRDYVGTINEKTKTVEFHISDQISVLNLLPTITISNKATTPAIVAKDFSSPVIYTITAEDGSSVPYTIKVNKYRDFKSKWRTTSANQVITLPLYNSYGLNGFYDCWVNWGDGSKATHITSNNVGNLRSHTYATPGEYTITISGKIVGFNFTLVPASKTKIIDIIQWGDMHIGRHNQHFKGATNLVINADDSPNFKYIGSLKYSFAYIPNLSILNFNNWDLRDVSSMERMFEGSTNFNQTINNSSTVNVKDMSFMFFNTNFNSPVHFETRAVTNMQSMFENAKQFNQRLNFYTASVKNMKSMFRNATNYNQPIDFNITSLETTQLMFNYCTNFNSSVRFTGQSHRLNDISFMFAHATKFNQPVQFGNNPNYTTGLRNMACMFSGASQFNSSITINTENVTQMYGMFANSSFNQPINFNTKNVVNMQDMFMDCPFNQALPSSFVTSKVTSMENMFANNSNFNQAIDFDVAKVSNFNGMFFGASNFSSALILHNLGQVNCSMKIMFYNAKKFNYDISNWNVSKVTNVVGMFQYAESFNCGGVANNISAWRFSLIAKEGILGTSDDFDNGAAIKLTPQWGPAPSN